MTELYPGQKYFHALNPNIRRAEENHMHQEFEVHLLNDEGIAKAKKLANLFDQLLTELDPLMPIASRYTSLVRTKLEEASFFAKKAMAILPENQR
jgi:hypothetical protein